MTPEDQQAALEGFKTPEQLSTSGAKAAIKAAGAGVKGAVGEYNASQAKDPVTAGPMIQAGAPVQPNAMGFQAPELTYNDIFGAPPKPKAFGVNPAPLSAFGGPRYV